MAISLRNARPVEAVIFNMDGLLVDTGKPAMRAPAAAACSMGVDVPEAFRHSLIDVPAGQPRRMAGDHGGPGLPGAGVPDLHAVRGLLGWTTDASRAAPPWPGQFKSTPSRRAGVSAD